MGDPADLKDCEAECFASELAQELEKGRTANAYQKLVVAAAPHFHGLLNSQLNDHTRALVVKNIEKDFTTHNERELPTRLKEALH